jgi:hypothetical protein
MGLKNIRSIEIGDTKCEVKYNKKLDVADVYEVVSQDEMTERRPCIVSKFSDAFLVLCNFTYFRNNNFTEKEIEAILYHEIGHLHSKYKGVEGRHILDEIQADKYAVKRVGSSVLKSALNKQRTAVRGTASKYNVPKEKLDKILTELHQRENSIKDDWER